MVVTACASPPLTPYPELFQHYVQWGIEHLLAGVGQWEGRLSSELRERALHLLTFALRLEQTWPEASRLLLAISPALMQNGDWHEWLPNLEAALAQSQSQGDQATAAELCLQLGILNRWLANYAVAQSWFRQSADGFCAIGNDDKHAQVLNHLGFVAWMQGSHQAAADWVDAALPLLAADALERATSYSILGSIAYDQRDWGQAIDYFQQALTLRQRQPDQRRLAWVHNDLAAAFSARQNYEEALTHYQQALTLLTQIDAVVQYAITQMNVGNVYLALQQPATALQAYQAAHAILQRVQDERHLAMLTNNIGIVYRQLGHLAQARAALEESLTRWQKLGNPAALVNTLEELATLHLTMADIPAAKMLFTEALDRLPEIENQTTRSYYAQKLHQGLHQVEVAHIP